MSKYINNQTIDSQYKSKSFLEEASETENGYFGEKDIIPAGQTKDEPFFSKELKHAVSVVKEQSAGIRFISSDGVKVFNQFKQNRNQQKVKFFGVKTKNGTMIFSKPKPEQLDKWMTQISRLQDKLKNAIAGRAIKDIMNNFSTEKKEIQQLITQYISTFANCPFSTLASARDYGYFFVPPTYSDLQLNLESKLSGLGVDKKKQIAFKNIFKNSPFEELIAPDSSGNNSALPGFSEFSSGRKFFRSGSLLFGDLMGVAIAKGRTKENDAMYLNLPLLNVIHAESYPLANPNAFPENRNCIFAIQGAIKEAIARKINSITMSIGILDPKEPLGHQISITIHVDRTTGKVDGFCFNNTNRYSSKDSFYKYYFPYIKLLHSQGMLTSELDTKVKQILISIEKFCKEKNNGVLNFAGDAARVKNTKIRDMLSFPAFEKTFEGFYNFKNKKGEYRNFEINSKFQGASGFCMNGSEMIDFAMIKNIAEFGYPTSGRLEEEKRNKGRNNYHRRPNYKFGNGLRLKIKQVYKELNNQENKINYSSNSDLETIHNISRRAIYQKIECINALAESRYKKKQNIKEVSQKGRNMKFIYKPSVKAKYDWTSGVNLTRITSTKKSTDLGSKYKVQSIISRKPKIGLTKSVL